MKGRSIYVLLLLFIAFFIWSFTSNSKVFIQIKKSNSSIQFGSDSLEITVGKKTSDSTGQITISSAAIRQAIIPTIPPLAGISFTSSGSTLIVTPVTAYLLLKGNNAQGEGVSVAIQLLIEGIKIFYKAHGNTVVHVCKSSSSCGSCQFVQAGNMITNCKCANGSNVPDSCRDVITWLR